MNFLLFSCLLPLNAITSVKTILPSFMMFLLSQGILMVYILMKSRIILQTASFLHQQSLREGWNYMKFSKPTGWPESSICGRQDRRIGNNFHTCSWCFSTYTHQSACLFWQALSKKWPSKHSSASFLSHFFGHLKAPVMCRCACAWQGWAAWQHHQNPETRFSWTCSM